MPSNVVRHSRPQTFPRWDVQLIWKSGSPPEDLVLADGVLFYPCAEKDWQTPVRLFRPWIRTFWFADISYRIPPPLEFLREPRPERHRRNREHVVRTSSLIWEDEAESSVELHWQQQDGMAALRNLDREIGIFFYRGDSSDGSNLWWLFHTASADTETYRSQSDQTASGEWEDEEEFMEIQVGHMHEVLKRLADGGLIVTDGSKGDGDGKISRDNPYSYSNLSAFLGDRDIDPEKAMEKSPPFKGPLGHSFECIGCINRIHPWDKGPTLVWRVRHPA